MSKKTRLFSLAVIVGAFVGLSGCASTSTTDDLQSQINAIQADVATAKADAAAANAKATEAMSIANQANSKAISTEADINARIDRMFKKTMQK